jgi:Raf kinase inhibitor-like YbhB/YbcL family protein
MKKHFFIILFTLGMITIGGNAMALTLTSSAFAANSTIPKEFTCDGVDDSPPLAWQGAPQGTKSFAIIMDDPDAPPGTWVHWILFNIPSDTQALGRAVEKKETLKSGAKHGLVWGVNDFSRVGYFGPCPPPGKPHRYFFKLYALDGTLNLPAKATKAQVEATMKGHVLGEASLVGLYGR